MYWNKAASYTSPTGTLINRNMRCIEIFNGVPMTHIRPRLIETWDVLKFLLPYKLSLNQLINRNMRCIEITWRGKQLAICEGLIETWDVLKCVN